MNRSRHGARAGRAVCLAFALVVALAGCGGSSPAIESTRTEVSGTIAYEGRPLAGGSVTFVSATNPILRVSALIRPDGSFQVADAPKGPVKYGVETVSMTHGGDASAYIEIPSQYAQPERSGLTAEIVPGGPPLDLQLKALPKGK